MLSTSVNITNRNWIEITIDNVDEVYDVPVNRLVIGYIQGGMTVARMYQDMSPSINTMAKLGGYYFYVLPEIVDK